MDRNSEKALVLIPCCKQKRVFANRRHLSPPIQQIHLLRKKLEQMVIKTPKLSNKPENIRGIFNIRAPLTQARLLYSGQFYHVAGSSLDGVLAGQFPFVHILIVSAYYGLVKLDEGLKEYELQMSDRLSNGMKVYLFWQRAQLWKLLEAYIFQNRIKHVWSLLPDSKPLFPYQQVFKNFWNQTKSTPVRCFHVKIPGAGSSTGRRRAEWLAEILKTNPNYLLEKPFPPNRFQAVPMYGFHYNPCCANMR